MRATDAEKAELVASILAPHDGHRFGACGDDLCEDCAQDLGLAIARGAERERLKALVWKWSEMLDLTAPDRDALAALFEVSR